MDTLKETESQRLGLNAGCHLPAILSCVPHIFFLGGHSEAGLASF